MRSNTASLALIVLVAALACACNSSKLTGSNKDSDATSNRVDDEKKSDESEGVPGYLRDPEDWNVATTGGNTRVGAGEGSVVMSPGATGKPSDLVVIAWRASDLEGAGATRIAEAAISTAGAFEIGFTEPDSGFVILSLSRAGSEPRLIRGGAVGRRAGSGDAFSALPSAGGALVSRAQFLASVPLLARPMVETCLLDVYDETFELPESLPPYREIHRSALPVGAEADRAISIVDPPSGKREVVFVQITGSPSSIEIKLQNDKAIYCPSIQAVLLSGTPTLEMACNAEAGFIAGIYSSEDFRRKGC